MLQETEPGVPSLAWWAGWGPAEILAVSRYHRESMSNTKQGIWHGALTRQEQRELSPTLEYYGWKAELAQAYYPVKSVYVGRQTAWMIFASENNITSISYTPNVFRLELSPLYGTVNAAQGAMNIEPDTNAAKGIAIQIATGSAASNALFNLGSEHRIISPNDGRAEISLPLIARYIKMDDKVSAGKTDGKVVFTINYY